ncbi:ACT domain-containing protein [Oceanicaulis sp. MMSF_3324]|uniref:ACT domain-containing protein n=1 Tax=Oceanicaulis sp. MMSF_3324 TaxID=3046702 RepID=UPI00273D4A36|nr:ACT domain-containing protein [Oceanicaulis sp. MMSF_3324]
MTPLTDLDALLRDMKPCLDPERYAYAALQDQDTPWPEQTVAWFEEDEGRSVIAPYDHLLSAGLPVQFPCRRITLSVYSALEAVGLTAQIATALARAGISANLVAGLHHDHVFVPETRAEQALSVLETLSETARR